MFRLLLLSFWLAVGGALHGQAFVRADREPVARYRVVFYNVENLFDTRNDPATEDDDFTPRGKQYWNKERYTRKLLHLGRVFAGVGEGEWPLLVGLAEVENRRVLEELTKKTELAACAWGIVHADSPDPRGIDVALLYRTADFSVLTTAFFPMGEGKAAATREILYCKGVVAGSDTLHCFVCHFPSMRGGERRSEWKRVAAARLLREKVDSIQALQPAARILVMGDMNGEATTAAQKLLGKPLASEKRIVPDGLYHTVDLSGKQFRGSYRYQGRWQVIDHILVSGSLLDAGQSFYTDGRMGIFAPAFLLEEQAGSYGDRPLPTYRGPRYLGGYSDHLPVWLDFNKLLTESR